MATHHISAEPGDFAETVLLPGDPLRARHIAETYLTDAREVTAVRNMLGYTGTYRGVRVSTMGTGMGIPSASIYSTELITEFGVRNLIRVGTCGAMSESIALRDVIIAISASTDSNANRMRFGDVDFAATADWHLVRTAVEAADHLGISVHVGPIFSSDLFYLADETRFARIGRMGALGVEMEAAGIYGAAAEQGARALAICSVSDHLLTAEAATPEERETSFGEMMQIALETAAAL
jgi:purine-nucleoside phosphorylase